MGSKLGCETALLEEHIIEPRYADRDGIGALVARVYV